MDWICSNIPFSKFNDILEKSVKIANKGIAFLVGIMNISPKRLKMLEDNNFGITTFHISQVTGWLGCSVYFIAEKNKPSIIKYTRQIYKMPEDEHKIYNKKQKEYQAKYYKEKFQTKLKKFRINYKKRTKKQKNNIIKN